MPDTITDLDAEIAKFEEPEVEFVRAEPEPEPEPEAKEEKVAEPEPEPEKSDADDMEARVRRLHIEAREAKRAAQQAQREAEIARGNVQLPKDEQVVHEAQQMAKQIAATESWNKECNRINESGMKGFKDFDKVVADIKGNFDGGVPAALIEGAIEVMPGEEAKMLHYLGKNLDVAEHILSLSPVKAGAALSKLADKINAPKPVSSAPAPIKPVAGNSGDDANAGRSGYYEGMSVAAFMKMEAKERKNRYR